MKDKTLHKRVALGLTLTLLAGSLTGCRFGFASDPDDPNESKQEVIIDTSTDTFSYDESLKGTNITLLNTKAEIQVALEDVSKQFEEKSGIHVDVVNIS